jgi:hypothetical protein
MRVAPENWSTPTVASRTPMNAIASDLTVDPELTADTSTSPRKPMAAIPGGPRLRAKSAIWGASSAIPTTATTPPTRDPIAEMPSADAARPCFAIG